MTIPIRKSPISRYTPTPNSGSGLASHKLRILSLQLAVRIHVNGF